MITLSVRQPLAWLIIHAGKDIENRTWSTRQRGRVQIHASKGMTRREYVEACQFVFTQVGHIFIPSIMALAFGGVIGSVEIVDCVNQSDSKWFVGPKGFVLRDPKSIPFTPCTGALGFFEQS